MGCVRGRIVCSCIWIRVSWMLRKLSVMINFLKKYNVKNKNWNRNINKIIVFLSNINGNKLKEFYIIICIRKFYF